MEQGARFWQNRWAEVQARRRGLTYRHRWAYLERNALTICLFRNTSPQSIVSFKFPSLRSLKESSASLRADVWDSVFNRLVCYTWRRGPSCFLLFLYVLEKRRVVLLIHAVAINTSTSTAKSKVLFLCLEFVNLQLSLASISPSSTRVVRSRFLSKYLIEF